MTTVTAAIAAGFLGLGIAGSVYAGLMTWWSGDRRTACFWAALAVLCLAGGLWTPAP